MPYEIITGDVLEILPSLEAESFDSCLCDPPYHLTSGNGTKGFMSKEWDGGDVAFRKATWEAVRRVLKPGAFLLAFGAFLKVTSTLREGGCSIRSSSATVSTCSRG